MNPYTKLHGVKMVNKIRKALKALGFKVTARTKQRSVWYASTVKFGEFSLEFGTSLVNYIVNDKTLPTIQATLVLDIPSGGNTSTDLKVKVKRAIEAVINRKFSDHPWYFDDCARYTLGGGQSITLAELQEQAQPYEQKPAAPKYDPQAEYFNRMTSSARSRMAARQSHQFADSIGGCSSNYRF